ncbi:type VII secretion protein EccCa [Pseudonocardia phyllosphaerae]|uniref:type VII secretion protein EccCa n=1 Tax=Pseudonocardia phyllosphaerae TaxID=3390502 RepID=UPI003978BF80
MGATIGVRRPRRAVPELPAGDLVIEPPPEPERPVPAGPLQRLLPLAMVGGSLLFVVVGHGDANSWLFGGMFALSALGMMVTGGGRGPGARAAAMDEDRRDYLRYLDVLACRVRDTAAAQRLALETVHPEPAAWPDVLAAGRIWERRPGDDDFARLRIGRGTQRLATPLVAPRTGPVDTLEPLSVPALRRFLRRHATVPGLPIALDLRATTTVWLEPELAADPGPALDLARALVAQYVLWHGPDDARLAVVTADPASWDWVKWLPHNGHPRHADAVGPVRMITDDPDEVRGWWAGERAAAQQHLLVVVDAVGNRADTPGAWAGLPGVTTLRVGPSGGRRPAASVLRLAAARAADGAAVLRRGGPDGPAAGTADAVTVAEARALARRLARYRPEGVAVTDDDPAEDPDAGPAGLPALLGLDGLGPDRIAALRASRPHGVRLQVPLGTDDAGRPVVLDLKESAQGGAGPHGLCIGATGSGKSELLRTLVLGLVATHTADELNLVLVDFKGGATFLGLSGLPHVSAVITNLVSELSLVDRMADALAGEMTRRQELLRTAGNLASQAEYEAWRAGNNSPSSLPALPSLLVVVDEFSELLARRPEMIDLMVTVGRLGRSLGIHLLLASQRIEEGRLRGLESHLSYRIALRTFSAAESRAVLGVPDAHLLPPTPGAAYLSAGTDELVRFRAAYVSGPYRAPDRRRAGARAAQRVLPFGTAVVAAPPVAVAPVARPVPDDGGTTLDLVVAAVSGPGPRAHRVWLPPLDDPPPLTAVLGTPVRWPGRGLAAPGPAGRLLAPVGLVDQPYLQRRDPLVLDLSGAAGHLAVVGGPRAGKSTALRTAVTALALTHTPDELGVHAVDLGGGTLAPLAGLPHVGTVAGRRDADLVRRVVADAVATVERRAELFAVHRIGSVEEFRARRAAGDPVTAGEPCTDLVVVVDGYGALRADFEDLDEKVTALATQGLGHGVHLAVTASRWAEFRPALKDQLGSRLELRLGDPGDSEIDRRRAATVPARAGHGLDPGGAAAVVATPALGPGPGGAAPDDAASTRRPAAVPDAPAGTVAAIAAAWPGPGMPAVRLLPHRITVSELPPGPGRGIAVGVDEDRLGAVELDPAEPHLLCFADSGGGKTNLLRLLARGIAARWTPEQARIVVVDHRRTLLGAVAPSHLLAHTATAAATADAAAEIAGSLRRRLPGPDVTPAQLRERSWWSGPELWLLVDDYDLVAPAPGGAGAHPLQALVEFLAQAGDVGLHLVVARRTGGAARAMFDPVLGRLRELGAPGLVGSGSADEGPLLERTRPAPLPPGRTVLVDRRAGARRIQLARVPSDEP